MPQDKNKQVALYQIKNLLYSKKGFPDSPSGKEPACQ